MRTPSLESSRSPAWVLTATVLVTAVLAIAAHLTLELWPVEPPASPLRKGSIEDHLAVFWVSTLVIWLIVVLVLAVVGRLWLTVGLVLLATVGLAYANSAKLRLRLEPLYPSDLSTAPDLGFLRQMVGWRATLTMVAVTLSVLVLAVVVGRLAERRFPRVRREVHPRVARAVLVGRGSVVLVVLAGLLYATGFNTPGNLVRATYEDSGAGWLPWHQRANYERNGFVAGMLYNSNVPGMTRPPGYSAATMRQIARRYAAGAARVNEHRSPDALDDVNVVMVLSETFTDPTRIPGVDIARDPIPFTRELMRRTTSGSALVSHFGGGTANAEFGALTGMSLALFQPQMTMPYQMLVPDYARFPSLAGYFDRLGHETVAIHAFGASMYRRPSVYQAFGFDELKFDQQMRHRAIIGDSEYISDAAAFKEVRGHLTTTDAPVFLHLVTMQNHFPMAGKYQHPIPVAGLEDPGDRRNAEHYMRGLRHSDDALRRLVGSLERSDEKTVLLLYGDHQPAFWPPAVQRAAGGRLMRETAFFVYANFGRREPSRLPTTSPANFAGHVLDAAGARLPPYLVLLRELEQEVPAMEHVMSIGADNRRIPPGGLSARAKRLLRDYRLVQYDLSVGERYVQDEMFPQSKQMAAASGG